MGPIAWLSARLRGCQMHVGMKVSTKRKGQTRRSSPMGKCLQGSRHLSYGEVSPLDHLARQQFKITLSYTQHSSCGLSRRYPLSSTQRCSTYKQYTAHGREQQQCSVETGNEGNVAYVHWLGEGCCPSQYLFHTSYFSQTLHVEFCIMYNPKS